MSNFDSPSPSPLKKYHRYGTPSRSHITPGENPQESIATYELNTTPLFNHHPRYITIFISTISQRGSQKRESVFSKDVSLCSRSFLIPTWSKWRHFNGEKERKKKETQKFASSLLFSTCWTVRHDECSIWRVFSNRSSSSWKSIRSTRNYLRRAERAGRGRETWK